MAIESEQKWVDHLVLVRHGESRRNMEREAAYAAGHAEYGDGLRDMDTPLTDRGQKQAVATAQYLAEKFRFDRVFVSPFQRAIETAKIMFGQFQYPVDWVQEERIREREFGVLDGLTPRGIAGRFPDEHRRKSIEGKYYYRPPGGESYPDVALRVHSFLGTLTREHRKQSVLVVSHAIVVLTFRRLLERWTEEEMLAVDQNPDQGVCNCSVAWYSFDPNAGTKGKLVLKERNGVHYPDELASSEQSRKRAEFDSKA